MFRLSVTYLRFVYRPVSFRIRPSSSSTSTLSTLKSRGIYNDDVYPLKVLRNNTIS